MTKLRALSVLVVVLLCGCAKKVAVGGDAFEAGVAGAAAPAQMAARGKTLAYEHTVSLEVGKDELPVRLQALQQACNADREHGCTLLDIESSTSLQVPYGSVRMRLAPGGVESMIAAAGQGGRIVERRTHAEDLAEPVADTQRELALLTLHRNRLEEFLKSRELKVEQLLTVSKELAAVQTQIDGLGSYGATLQRRIDTELLTISLSVPQDQRRDADTPVRDALLAFGDNFREAFAQVLLFLAMVLPWLVVVVPGVVLSRVFWRWAKRDGSPRSRG